jgi:hypothetical protein
MKMNFELAPATATKSVAPHQTYNFGFGDQYQGYSLGVSNGRVIEKTKRKIIFIKKHGIVKL